MKSNGSAISRLSALALGVFLGGAPLAARAAQPQTAAEAESRAQHYSELAKAYKLQGGVQYKTGNVQRAELAASSCATIADAMQANTVIVATPADSGALDESGSDQPTAGIAVVVPSTEKAPASPKCPAP